MDPTPRPPTAADPPDLVAAVAATLRQFRDHPGEVAEAAETHGVAVEVMEAAVVASVVSEWLSRQPGLADRPPNRPAADALADSLDGEAARASVAAEQGRSVVVAVRLPPLLAIRLVELAAETNRTPERTAADLLAAGADPALAGVRRRRGRPEPRPWDGGPPRGS